MSAQHTPGPWAISIADPHRVVLANGSSKGLEVAQAKEFVPQYREQSLANARLIAAAPDLLEALQTLLGWVEAWDVGFLFDDEWPADEAKIKAAIAKATGAA